MTRQRSYFLCFWSLAKCNWRPLPCAVHEISAREYCQIRPLKDWPWNCG